MKDYLRVNYYSIMYIEYWGQTTTSTESMNLEESNPWKLKWKNNSRIQLNKTLQNTGIEKSVTLCNPKYFCIQTGLVVLLFSFLASASLHMQSGVGNV